MNKYNKTEQKYINKGRPKSDQLLQKSTLVRSSTRVRSEGIASDRGSGANSVVRLTGSDMVFKQLMSRQMLIQHMNHTLENVCFEV